MTTRSTPRRASKATRNQTSLRRRSSRLRSPTSRSSGSRLIQRSTAARSNLSPATTPTDPTRPSRSCRRARKASPTRTSPATPSTARRSDLIAWDVPGLIEPPYDQFGAFTIAIVMAHEFGHAIQERAGHLGRHDPAGAAGRLLRRCLGRPRRRRRARERFQVEVDDLDQAVAGFLELRDGIGTAAADPLAHGSGVRPGRRLPGRLRARS